MNIEKKFPLGRGARFQIRFTTPLGDDFVSVTSRGSTSAGRLADGATVPPADTSNAPGIEDTFAAVSLLLNGGGLSKLKTIVTELNTALHGRTGDARDALIKLHAVIANLDDHKADIDRTLDGLASMSEALNKGTAVVEQALALFPPTLQTLADDTAQIRDLLTRVGRLGTTVDGPAAPGPDRDAGRLRQSAAHPRRVAGAAGRTAAHLPVTDRGGQGGQPGSARRLPEHLGDRPVPAGGAARPPAAPVASSIPARRGRRAG